MAGPCETNFACFIPAEVAFLLVSRCVGVDVCEQGFSQIGDDGVKSIAAAVEKSSSLRELHLVR